MSRKTVFLDRDGVLNHRIMAGYVTKPDELVLLHGVAQALLALKEHGFRLAVVTNQQGIAKGLMTHADLARVHQKLDRITDHVIDQFYICPHYASSGCACRKPKPGLLDQADAAEAVDWAASYLIGDSDSDIQAGLARGVYTLKVAGHSAVGADHQASDLVEAVAHLLERDQKAKQAFVP